TATGTYPLVYSVHDSAGLGATTTRNVVVVASSTPPANQPPVIILLGANPLMVVKGGTYSDPGATASDPEDGNLTSQIKRTGDVNTSVAGTYVWVYSVYDSASLGATTTRDVVVYHTTPTSTPQCSDGIDNDGDQVIDIDDPTCHSDKDPQNPTTYNPNKDTENEAPVIALTGNANLTVSFGSSFTDPGATASDFEDGDITANIVKSGDVVNTSNAGPYTIKYNIKDSQGLAAQEKTRTVQVTEQGHGGGGGGGGGSVIVSSPTLVISNEKLQEQGQGQVIFTWETNNPADSKVVYGTSSVIDLKSWSLDYGYPLATAVNSALIKTHSVVIFGLNPALKYYFRPVSDNPQSSPVVGKQLVWPTEPVVPPVVPPAVGECYYLLEYLKIGQANNPVEVRKLQTFLNLFNGANLPVDGFFDQATFRAVEKFQAEYQHDVLLPWGGIDPTGYVYITTKKKVNELYCQRPFPLTGGQQQEVNDYRDYFLQYPEAPTGEVGFVYPTYPTGTEGQSESEQGQTIEQTPEQPTEPVVTGGTSSVSLNNEGLVANIGSQAPEQEEIRENEESEEGKGFLSSLGVAGMGGLVSNQMIYWFALIFMILVLFSVVLYFRAKRKKEIPYSVPPFPENIPVQ
ncbi:MAG: DUF5011 domain-containing protein, partial [bacterium]|nr:DUF5011 domain-containing protein [bacterium]